MKLGSFCAARAARLLEAGRAAGTAGAFAGTAGADWAAAVDCETAGAAAKAGLTTAAATPKHRENLIMFMRTPPLRLSRSITSRCYIFNKPRLQVGIMPPSSGGEK